MVFTKRERLTGIIALLGAGILMVDLFGVEPLLNYRKQIKTDQAKAELTLVAARKLIKEQPEVDRLWRERLANGLKDNASDAESQIQTNLARWGVDTGLTLTSSRQDRPTTDKDKLFQEIVFRASANGSMYAFAQMLARIETTRLPLRINALSITPRKEGTDDLTGQLTLSTLCVSTTPETEGRSPAARGGQP